MKWRKTKIIASLGPATDSDEVLLDLIDAGIDAARINCSHQDRQEILSRGRALREAALQKGRSVALLVDLQGPKIRLTGDTLAQDLKKGQILTIGSANDSGPDTVSVNVPDVGDLLEVGSEIVIGDGYPRLIIESVGEKARARVVKPGPVSANKGFIVTHSKSGRGLTEKDLADLETAVDIKADFIALSFVRDDQDILDVREFLKKKGSRARVIAKIEKLEAFENIDAIIEAADGVLVARGDYGIEAGFSKVPVMQKQVIEKASKAGVLSITATQMLESMITSPLPTRAESSDVANAVFDGTSAVMLSAETAVGKYPVEVVKTMAEIIEQNENYIDFQDFSRVSLEEGTTHDSIMSSAATLALEMGADAIAVATESGRSARAAARHRPKAPIFALTPFQRVADQLALEWGIFGIVFPEEESTRALIEKAGPILKDLLDKEAQSFVLIRGDEEGPHTIRFVRF